ncbi:glucuronate isomerase [Streptococcus sp. sy018]|uniref:glucuronate isomerase n=1 Tax=Streptococcus sp. sy018 TaxID=2600147 RepID=UPI0011B729C6|nr:glucuronate isomerase [Streptococcus sp. sy018]TWS95366.1 glucuronate isomerase [Streptococcus sp. sy018]
MTFNDASFMLKNKPAHRLYHQIKDLPIYDFHCHLDPKEIYEDCVYENIVDLWLEGDHYKWRLMRVNGISEEEITGSASPFHKFQAWIKTVSKAYGNPLYHWSHLELAEVFGITEPIVEDKVEELYERLNSLLKEKQISPRQLIKAAQVTFIGTTDHPLDDLEWHKKLAADESFETVVAPTFRPDEAFIEHQNFNKFINRLSEKTNRQIDSFDSLVDALEERVAYFAQVGCLASDISFTEISFELASKEELNELLTATLAGQQPDILAIRKWQTAVFVELCRLYKQYGFVTQVHFGALRNNHKKLFNRLGADVGVDSIGDQSELAIRLNQLLNHLVQKNCLPKMIWYNLNPTYNIVLSNTLANFQANEKGIKSQLQFGAGWWFNDTKLGMIEQMNAYAEQGLLANFVGMLTDSRSFLSYQRHDYFRRILASYVGQWIADEEVPEDYQALGKMVEAIAYHNAKEFFER